MSYQFSNEEKEAIRQAVGDLEKVSCGEIVPYYVNSSDDYTEASWYLSSILGAAISLIVAALSFMWQLPFHLTPMEASLSILGGMVIGFLFPIVLPGSKRWIISKSRQAERVGERAAEAFLSEKVFETNERVGILIFISFLEHQVLVVGDKGINAKVQPSDWQHVVDEVVQGVKDRSIGNGLVAAIDQCKDLLLKHDFVRKSTDYNELDDGLRIEGES